MNARFLEMAQPVCDIVTVELEALPWFVVVGAAVGRVEERD